MDIPKGIKLRHIAAFLDISGEGTISGAARRQNISQPALSKTIAELETMLAVTLFDRAGRRTILTAHGETFRRYALSAVQSLETGCRALGGGGRTDMVSVGVLPTVAGGFFPAVALDFAETRPEARISIMTGPNSYLLECLRSGVIDLMVGRLPSARDMPGLQFEYLFEEPITLVGRAGHPMLGHSISEVLLKCPLILPNPGAIIRHAVDDYLNAAGISNPRPAFETVSLPFARGLLERSDMLWFISRGVVARELETGELVAFDLQAQQMSGAVGLTTKFSPEKNTHVDFLVTLLHRRATVSQIERRGPK